MATALLIDENPSRRAIVRSLLLDAGLSVEEPATDCESDVLGQAHARRPNLIALPLNWPGVDLAALCRSLRADPACSGMAIVVLTDGRALADPPDETCRIKAALAGGADEILTLDELRDVTINRIRRLILFHQLTAMTILNEQLAQVGRLVAGIIHEIRSPLTVIRGNAELMALELGPDHAAGIWFRPILRNAQTLQIRLEHLMAAVRTGPRDPRPLDVVPLLRESINLFEKGIDGCRGHVTIDLTLDPGAGPVPPVLVDAGRLIQVVLNLLANAHDAITAERPDGRIEIQVKPDPTAGEVQIDVQDNGPGVSPGFLDRIFEPFFTTKSGGTGYGLYLAAEILREHGGRLVACNPAIGGACFSIHLPIAPTELPSSQLVDNR